MEIQGRKNKRTREGRSQESFHQSHAENLNTGYVFILLRNNYGNNVTYSIWVDEKYDKCEQFEGKPM